MRAFLTLICLTLLNYFSSFSQAEGFAESTDIDIFYQTFGDGEPVVILNGGPGFPSNHFVKFAQKLSDAGSQTIIFDQRGTGRSQVTEINNSNITMDLMVADMEAVRKHLGIEKWTVFGHSFGGMYGMYYATKYPKRIKSLVLSHSGGIDLEFANSFAANRNLRLSQTERDSFAFWTNPKNVQKYPDYARIGMAKSMAPAYVYDKKNVPTVIEGMTELSRYEPQINALVWQDLRAINYNLREDLRTFKQPVLIVGGKQDLLGESTAYEIHMALPNSQLELMNECGHYGWLDQPVQYFRIIETFLCTVSQTKMVDK